MRLSSQQVRFFRSAGYLRVPNVFPTAEIQHVREAANQIASELNTENRHKYYGIYDRMEGLRRLVKTPNHLGVLQSLLGPNVVICKNRHNHLSVYRKGDTSFRLHRDVLHWSRPVVTILIYLQDTGLNEGPTWIIPTSQYMDFVVHDGGPGHGGTWMDEHEEFGDLFEQAVPVPCQLGDVLILDSLAFHSAGRVLGGEDRMLITLAVRAIDELDPIAHQDNRLELLTGRWVYHGKNVEQGAPSDR